MSIIECGAFLINSNGISSDLGLGILGEPSLDLTLLLELSLERASLLPFSIFKLAPLLGLSPSLWRRIDSSALWITPGELSLLGAANPTKNKSIKSRSTTNKYDKQVQQRSTTKSNNSSIVYFTWSSIDVEQSSVLYAGRSYTRPSIRTSLSCKCRTWRSWLSRNF